VAQAEARLRAKSQAEGRAGLCEKPNSWRRSATDLLQPLMRPRLFLTERSLNTKVPAASSPVISARSSPFAGDVGKSCWYVWVDISKLDAGVIKPDIAAIKLLRIARQSGQ